MIFASIIGSLLWSSVSDHSNRETGTTMYYWKWGLALHRSPKRPKTVLSGGRLREMTWWSQTNFFRDHLYHCYGFYLDRLDTPSSFSLISENQLIFRFWAIFDTKFSCYRQFEGTSSLSSVFVQLNSRSIMKKLKKCRVSDLSRGLTLPATNI